MDTLRTNRNSESPPVKKKKKVDFLISQLTQTSYHGQRALQVRKMFQYALPVEIIWLSGYCSKRNNSNNTYLFPIYIIKCLI